MSLDGDHIKTMATFSRPSEGVTDSTVAVEARDGSVILWVTSSVGMIAPMLLPEDVDTLCEELRAAVEQLDEEAVDERRQWIETRPPELRSDQ